MYDIIMRILVCIRQIADPESRFSLSADALRIEIDPDSAFVINRYDEFAVEEALRIRDAIPGAAVDVISVGPQRAKEAIRRALGMGAQAGIHILLEGSWFQDSGTVARLISSYARGQGYDLIFTGVMAEDTLNAQTGPRLAELLGLPCATTVISQELDRTLSVVRVEREIEALTREEVTLRLPALLTVQSGINHPRYPTLSNLLRAKKQTILTLEASSQDGARTECVTIVRLFAPERERAGLVLEGTTAEKARALCDILHERALL